MTASANRIQFACNNCMTPMEVRQRFAGRQVRCPYCQILLKVPLSSRRRKPGDEYGVAEKTSGWEAEQQGAGEYIAVRCSLCGTRMYATADQVGQKLVCPDCETTTVVPAATAGSRQRRDPRDGGSADEGYEVSRQGESPATVGAADLVYVPVVCKLCHTRMLATEDQVGQTMICPDCLTENEVRLPVQRPKAELPTTAEVGEYAVRPSEVLAEAPPEEPKPPVRQFAFKCPQCLSRMEAGTDEVGRKVTCPDCKRTFAVPKAPRKTAPLAPEAVEAYDVGAAAERGAVYPEEVKLPRQALEDERHDRDPLDRMLPLSERRPLPPWPLVNGVFDFPFRKGVRTSWLMFASSAVLLYVAARMNMLLFGVGGMMFILTIVLGGCLFVVGAFWWAWAALCCLSITRDAAVGSDACDTWPGGDWVDTVVDVFYIFNAAAGAAGLGLGLDQLLEAFAFPAGAGMILGASFFLPILLLAELETGYSFNPFSLPVWTSLGWALPAWLSYYALTAAVWFVTAALTEVALALPDFMGTIVGLFLWSTTIFIQFRLIGRLGWYLTEHARQPRGRARKRRSKQQPIAAG